MKRLRSPRFIVPALLAAAALTAVFVHHETPVSSSVKKTSTPVNGEPDSGLSNSGPDKESGNKDGNSGSVSGTTARAAEGKSLAEVRKANGENLADLANIPGGVAAVVSQPYLIDNQSFVISMDELSVKDADGHDIPHKLDPPATPDTYADRMAELAGGGLVMPVAYPEGEDRTEANRRLVTSKVLVEVPEGADRVALSSALHLTTEDLPSYAPRHVVLSAASPLQALAGLKTWRELPNLASVQLLLATHFVKRSMPNDPLVGNQWHLKYANQPGAVAGTDINVEGVWNYDAPANGWRGAGIKVGVVDDSLQVSHPDFAGNIDTVLDFDYNSNDSDPSPALGDNHGTACGGDVAGRGNNGIGISGSAPEATLVGFRLIAGDPSNDQIANSITRSSQDIQIKTNSWGPSDTGSFLFVPGPLIEGALQEATVSGRGGLGTVMLWAGGNGAGVNDNSNYDPFANSIYTLSVCAMDSQGERSYYAEKGANHLVTAPSSGDILGITTTDVTGSAGYNSASSAAGGDYTNDFGGTSSATPTTAGIVALILQRNPNLGYRDVQEILATTAKKVDANNSDWATNSAGFHFSHEYGAGLVNAGAAVAAAGTWTNLGPLVSTASTVTGGAIPENNSTGLTKTFNLGSSNVRAEHVTVKLKINHTSRGNLQILLTSPSGMTSRLSEVHSDTNDNYDWTFMTTHNWGERSTGTWTLKIADLSGAGNNAGGSLASAELTVYGTTAAPINPPPVVQITSPATESVFTPGSTVTVNVSATDNAAEGAPGAVAKVELLDGETVLGTDTEAPYSFQITPANGSHPLVARATDTENAAATSATVRIIMENSPTVITAASIGATPAYADLPLTVSGIVANDADGDTATYSYQWQSSSDQRTYSDAAGKTSATLPASPSNAGLLWRCRVTANDGHVDGPAFLTNIVNVVLRPQGMVAPGATYSYQSGLVLERNGNAITRDVMINEFSQGPAPGGVVGYSEWVELLTLRTTSLRKWSLKNFSNARLTFADVPAWDNIPAGTRVVIYNGVVTKDSLLPANDTDFSDRQMVIASNNASYFLASPSLWPVLSNNGDVFTLKNAADQTVAEIGFGSATTGEINIGDVGTGSAAYFTGGSDEDAKLAPNWLATSSMVARDGLGTKAAGDLFMSEYIVGASSSADKAIELFNPSSTTVNLSTSGYNLLVYPNSNGTTPVSVPLTGVIVPGGTFVIKKSGASATIVAQQTVTNSNFDWTGDDSIVLRKGTSVIDCFGETDLNPGAGWGTSPNLTNQKNFRRKSFVTQGDVTATNTFNPAAEWDPIPLSDFTGLGKHVTDIKYFGFSASPTTFVENAGASASTGTLSLATAPAANVVFTLTSSNTGVATVPATATILAGQTSVTFPISAVDDTESDGPQSISITAASTDYLSVSLALTVTDDEVSIVGVTPGKGNNAVNAAWIASIVAGTEDTPSLFRLAAGSTLPADLTLNATTGLISGTVNSAATGSFNVVIERYNSNGGLTSQSFTLTVGTDLTYSTWIAGFSGLSSTDGDADPDSDGLKNLIEFHLGLNPGTTNSGAITTERTATALSITYRRAKGLTGTTAVVEWSDTLAETWSSAGVTEQILEDNANDQLVKASVALTEGDTKKFIHLKVTQN